MTPEPGQVWRDLRPSPTGRRGHRNLVVLEINAGQVRCLSVPIDPHPRKNGKRPPRFRETLIRANRFNDQHRFGFSLVAD